MDENSGIKFALLVPCYNAGKYIDGFLKNISLLTRPFDEVLFYDDGSTDNTFDLLTAKGCKVIKGDKNRGQSYARNALAEATKAEWIHFHDVDDEMDAEFLELTVAKLTETNADVILGNADWIDLITRAPIIKWRYNSTLINNDPLSYFIANPLGIINTTYKKENFQKVGGFNEVIHCWEDADLHVRLAASGAAFAVVDKVIAFSLRHENGVSKDQLSCWACRLKFLKNYLAYYNTRVNKAVFESELKKVRNVFVASGRYENLGDVISLVKQYGLSLPTWKVSILHLLNKFLPGPFIKKMARITVGGA